MFRLHSSLLALPLLLACTGGGNDPDELVDGEHCGTISVDEIWSAGTHTLTCDVHVSDGAHLTIEAGADVLIDPDASLNAGCEDTPGSIAIEGTGEEPVWLSSTTGTTASWNYLRFCEDAEETRNLIRHTSIEHAGAYDNLTTKAGLILYDTEVLVEDVVIVDVTGHGADLHDGARFADGSWGLVLLDNTGDALRVGADGAGSVPVDLVATGNGEDLVRIKGGTVTADDTWAALSVPWYVEDAVGIEGTETTPAVLTIEPGAILYFNGSETLTVGSNDKPAGLLAVGTETEPIVMTAPGAPDPGAWGGVVVGPSAVDAETVFEHIEISYANYALKLYNASPTIDQAYLHSNRYCAIYLLDGAAPTVGEVTYGDNGEDLCD